MSVQTDAVSHRSIRSTRAQHAMDAARVLLVAEGSGGHLIPAMEVAQALGATGAQALLMYAQRPQVVSLMDELMRELDPTHVQVHPFVLQSGPRAVTRTVWRMWQTHLIWRAAREQLTTFAPDVVVGFGGWLSIPVIVAAERDGIPVLLHEQNAKLGRANRFLLDWADRVALSFPCAATGGDADESDEEFLSEVDGIPAVMTGLPIRSRIGTAARDEAADALGLSAEASTVLVLGGSQGSGALNQVWCQVAELLTEAERRAWQVIHLTGPRDHAMVQQAYTQRGLRAWVGAYLADMASAYALADVVVARAGASTIAELARCGKPAIVIPYPYAAGHQRENAKLVEAVGAAVRLEEDDATPQRLLMTLRQLLQDERLRGMMGRQMQALARPDATQRLTDAILSLAATRHWN